MDNLVLKQLGLQMIQVMREGTDYISDKYTIKFANALREMVKDGTLTWEELDTTETEITTLERRAILEVARADLYAWQMQTKSWMAPCFAKSFREMVDDGTLTWRELGIDD